MSYIIKASAWENELIEKIQDLFKNNTCLVSAYPNQPDSYMMKHPTAEILVRYTGSTYAKNHINDCVMDSVVSMEIIFLFKNLRDADGLYESIQRTLQSLLGSALENTLSPIWIENDELMGEHHGIWQYFAKIKFKSILVNPNYHENDIDIDG